MACYLVMIGYVILGITQLNESPYYLFKIPVFIPRCGACHILITV